MASSTLQGKTIIPSDSELIVEGKLTGRGSAVMAIAGGISFAQQTTPGNVLNWYEVGTWNATLLFGGANVGMTFTSQIGEFIRIGQLVIAFFFLQLSSKGSSVGQAKVSGLPYAPTRGGKNIVDYAAMAAGIAVPLWTSADVGLLTVTLEKSGAASNPTALADTDFTATSAISSNVIYKAA